MAAINQRGLAKAMDLVPMTTKQLHEELVKRGHTISFSYTCDIVNGRGLKRNPALRKAIAEVLGVPQFWIETPDPTEGAA